MTTHQPKHPGRKFRRAQRRLEERQKLYDLRLKSRSVPDKIRESLHAPGSLKGGF